MFCCAVRRRDSLHTLNKRIRKWTVQDSYVYFLWTSVRQFKLVKWANGKKSCLHSKCCIYSETCNQLSLGSDWSEISMLGKYISNIQIWNRQSSTRIFFSMFFCKFPSSAKFEEKSESLKERQPPIASARFAAKDRFKQNTSLELAFRWGSLWRAVNTGQPSEQLLE